MTDLLGDFPRVDYQQGDPNKVEELTRQIKKEDFYPNFINTQTIANFYLATYAHQLLNASVNHPQQKIYQEDTRYLEELKAKAHLQPLLQGLLENYTHTIALASSNAIIEEIVVNHTNGPRFGPHIDELIRRDKNYQKIKQEHEAHIRNGGRGFTFDHNRFDPALAWKLKQLVVSLGQPQDMSFKAIVQEIARISKDVIEDDYYGWQGLADSLEKYGNSNNLDTAILAADKMIYAHHTHGPMLEHTAVNPQNALGFLDAKQLKGGDWIVAECADQGLVRILQKYPNLIPLQVFTKTDK